MNEAPRDCDGIAHAASLSLELCPEIQPYVGACHHYQDGRRIETWPAQERAEEQQLIIDKPIVEVRREICARSKILLNVYGGQKM